MVRYGTVRYGFNGRIGGIRMFNDNEKQDIWFQQAELLERMLSSSLDKNLVRETWDRMDYSYNQYVEECRQMDFVRMYAVLETGKEMYYEKFKERLLSD
jgi:hypothetical protein